MGLFTEWKECSFSIKHSCISPTHKFSPSPKSPSLLGVGTSPPSPLCSFFLLRSFIFYCFADVIFKIKAEGKQPGLTGVAAADPLEPRSLKRHHRQEVGGGMYVWAVSVRHFQ